MADEKLNTGPAENISPEAAEPITTPEQAAASEPQQEQTGPAIPESGDVVVSFDKINELMAEKRQNARAEVEKAETPETPEAAAPGETPQPANTEEPKKSRRGTAAYDLYSGGCRIFNEKDTYHRSSGTEEYQ